MSVIPGPLPYIGRTVLALIGFTSSGLCAKESAPVDRISQRVSIGLATTRFDYREFDSGNRLNREHGPVNGVSAGWQGVWDSFLVESRLAYFKDTVSYDGETQSGRAVSTDTKETITEGAVIFGWRYNTDSLIEYQVLGGVGYREWERDIQSLPSVTGLFETYYWWYGSVGVKALYRPNQNSTLVLEAALQRPVKPQIDVEFKNAIDSVNLDMESKNAFNVSFEWCYRLSKSIDFSTGLFYQTWDLNKSDEAVLTRNGVAIGTVFEPASETEIKGLQVRMIKRF